MLRDLSARRGNNIAHLLRMPPGVSVMAESADDTPSSKPCKYSELGASSFNPQGWFLNLHSLVLLAAMEGPK